MISVTHAQVGDRDAYAIVSGPLTWYLEAHNVGPSDPRWEGRGTVRLYKLHYEAPGGGSVELLSCGQCDYALALTADEAISAEWSGGGHGLESGAPILVVSSELGILDIPVGQTVSLASGTVSVIQAVTGYAPGAVGRVPACTRLLRYEFDDTGYTFALEREALCDHTVIREYSGMLGGAAQCGATGAWTSADVDGISQSLSCASGGGLLYLGTSDRATLRGSYLDLQLDFEIEPRKVYLSHKPEADHAAKLYGRVDTGLGQVSRGERFSRRFRVTAIFH